MKKLLAFPVFALANVLEFLTGIIAFITGLSLLMMVVAMVVCGVIVIGRYIYTGDWGVNPEVLPDVGRATAIRVAVCLPATAMYYYWQWCGNAVCWWACCEEDDG